MTVLPIGYSRRAAPDPRRLPGEVKGLAAFHPATVLRDELNSGFFESGKQRCSAVGCRRDSNPRYGKSNLPSLSLGNDRRMSAGRSDLAKRVRLRSPPRQQQDCSESTGTAGHLERYCARHLGRSADGFSPRPALWPLRGCGGGADVFPATDGDPDDNIKVKTCRQADRTQC